MKNLLTYLFFLNVTLLNATCFEELMKVIQPSTLYSSNKVSIDDDLLKHSSFKKEETPLTRFQALLITNEEDQNIAIVKFDELKRNDNNDPFKNWIPPTRKAKREAFSYYVDHSLDFNLVSPTFLGKQNDISFSIQRFSKGLSYKDATGIKSIESTIYQKMALFDMITGQLDRHTGNFTIDQKQKVELIDNGESFPLSHPNMLNFYIFWKNKPDNNTPIDKAIVDQIMKADIEHLYQIGNTHFQIEFEALNLFKERFVTIKKTLEKNPDTTPMELFNLLFVEPLFHQNNSARFKIDTNFETLNIKQEKTNPNF